MDEKKAEARRALGICHEDKRQPGIDGPRLMLQIVSTTMGKGRRNRVTNVIEEREITGSLVSGKEPLDLF